MYNSKLKGGILLVGQVTQRWIHVAQYAGAIASYAGCLENRRRECSMMKLDKKLLKKVWYIAKPYIAGYLLLISIHWLALGLEGVNLFHDWFHQS